MKHLIHFGIFCRAGDSTNQGIGAKQSAVNWAGIGPIANDAFDDATQASSGLCLLFPAGQRPAAETVRRAYVETAENTGRTAARISHQGADWVELLASGLTFDLTGLSPGKPAIRGTSRRLFGIDRQADLQGHEAIQLAPGPHLADAGPMIPVFRTMASIASGLALALGAEAVCWEPASSCMEAGYFARIVSAWLDGGAFPALGLTGIDRSDDGSVQSDGLAWFTGQELQVGPKAGEPASETVKLAVRMIDHMVRHGTLESSEKLTGPEGEALLAVPSEDGRTVVLQRGD